MSDDKVYRQFPPAFLTAIEQLNYMERLKGEHQQQKQRIRAMEASERITLEELELVRKERDDALILLQRAQDELAAANKDIEDLERVLRQAQKLAKEMDHDVRKIFFEREYKKAHGSPWKKP